MEITRKIEMGELNDPKRWTTPESELMGYAKDSESARVIAATLNALIDRAERAERAYDDLRRDMYDYTSRRVYQAMQDMRVVQVLQQDGGVSHVLPILDTHRGSGGIVVVVGCGRLSEKQ